MDTYISFSVKYSEDTSSIYVCMTVNISKCICMEFTVEIIFRMSSYVLVINSLVLSKYWMKLLYDDLSKVRVSQNRIYLLFV